MMAYQWGNLGDLNDHFEFDIQGIRLAVISIYYILIRELVDYKLFDTDTLINIFI